MINPSLTRLCKSVIEYENKLGGMSYHACNCPVKYLVTYISPTRGEPIDAFVCGRHFIAIKKNVARILKRTKFDCQLTFKKV